MRKNTPVRLGYGWQVPGRGRWEAGPCTEYYSMFDAGC